MTVSLQPSIFSRSALMMSLQKLVFASLFLMSSPSGGFGQILDFNRRSPYQQVFVDTDEFGADYLQSLETALNNPALKTAKQNTAGRRSESNDSLYYAILNDLAYYWHTRNLNTALDLAQEGLQLTEQRNNPLWTGRFQITLGAILLRLEKLDSAEVILEEARKKVSERDLAFLNTQLGYVYERRGQLDKATNYAMESLRLGRKWQDKKAIALAYSDLSNIFWKQAKYKKGVEYGLESLAIFQQRGLDDLDYDFTLYVVGNNYLELKQYQNALYYYQRAIVIGERYGFYNNLSDIYISLVDLHTYLNKYQQAEKSGKNAIKYAELLSNNFMEMRAWLSMGKLHNKQGDFTEATADLRRSIAIATDDFGDEYYLSQAYQALGEALAGSGNYREAVEAFNHYDKLKDKVFSAESDQRTLRLQTEFEVAQKENTIGLQEARLEQQQQRQTFTTIVASLLLFLLLLLYLVYRQNTRKNRLLQRQNQEKEVLLKEVHHRVKNNLEIISSLLALQSSYLQDRGAVEALLDIQNRVHSMGFVHQQLYQGKKVVRIAMSDYFRSLGIHLLQSYGKQETVMIDYQLEPIDLDLDTAIPLGLIITELLSNALKYAFPDGRNGTVRLDAQRKDDNLIIVSIADDGIGQAIGTERRPTERRPTERRPNAAQGTGFGMQMVRLLTRQLDGQLTEDFTAGTRISFAFRLMS
ncbi:tetratricopeptide repeat protein [Persicitalea sp.]|uniref:tetratricopeptide repeat-containing sensor histidine kinase n=1 Tax=Persicitalea sp. TaxID=3100273 RepID=UPI003593A818